MGDVHKKRRQNRRLHRLMKISRGHSIDLIVEIDSSCCPYGSKKLFVALGGLNGENSPAAHAAALGELTTVTFHWNKLSTASVR